MIKKLDKKQTERVHELCKEIVEITGNAFITCVYKPKEMPNMTGSIGCIVGEALEIGTNICCVLTEKGNESIYKVVKTGLGIVENNDGVFSIKKEM